MAAYKFTGTTPETFPTILVPGVDGALVVLDANPGDVIDLPADPGHPRLVAVADKATVTGELAAVEDTHGELELDAPSTLAESRARALDAAPDPQPADDADPKE